MASGRDLLRSLDRSLNDVRTRFRRLDGELQRVTVDLGATRRREAQIYSRLARLRLDVLTADEFAQKTDLADRRAQELLQQREQRLTELTRELDQHEDEIQAATAESSAAAERLADEEDKLERLLAQVDSELDTNAEFQASKDKAQALVDQAARAAEKAAQAEAARREKGAPYDSDPLFTYLWQRGYGTQAYRAWPLARLMDGSVARHIGYEQARRNYWTLNEIPRRLRAHTERLETRATDALNNVAAAERKADVAAGAEQLEAAVADATNAKDKSDKNLAEVESRFEAGLKERQSFASGSDRFFTEAMALLVENFRHEPVSEIRRDAELTAHHEDDSLAAELGEVRGTIESLGRHLADQESVHRRHLERLTELKGVRQRYIRHRYDARDSMIDDRGNVELMLGEFLRGLVGSDRLWRVIRNSQRFRRRASTGRRSGGGFSVPRMPRGIRIPRGMGGGGGFKAPRMPRGGFKTKGGF